MKTITYYIICLALLVLYNPFLKAQPFYSNYLLNPLNNWTGGTAIFSKNDTTYFTAIGGGNNYYTDKAMLIGKLGSNGEITYQKTYQDSYKHFYPGIGGFYPVGDSSSIIVGSRGYEGMLFKLDQSFDTVIAEFFKVDTFLTIARSVDIIQSDGYIVSGDIAHYTFEPYISKSDGVFLYKTDSQFNLQWYRIFKPDEINYGFSVSQTSDNGYVIGGYTNSKTDYSGEPLVVKTDSQGNQVWIWHNASVYDDTQAITSVANDGNILVAYGHATYQAPPYPVPSSLTQIRVVKMDNDGNELWTRDYGGSYMGNEVTSITHLPDHTYLIGGDAWSNDTSTYGWSYTRAFLLKINENGDSLWMRHYIYEDEFGTQLNLFSHANTGPDESIMLIGCNQNFLSPTGEQSMWIMRLDSLGCDTPECNPFVGVKKPGIMKEDRILLHPNPANQFVDITIPVEYKSGNFNNPSVKFYDMNGRLVQKSIPDPDGISFRCPTNNLKPGIYFVQLIDRNCIIGSNKLLILR